VSIRGRGRGGKGEDSGQPQVGKRGKNTISANQERRKGTPDGWPILLLVLASGALSSRNTVAERVQSFPDRKSGEASLCLSVGCGG